MTKLKPHQVGPWCSFCDVKTKRAVYAEYGRRGVFCCADHVAEMEAHERDCADSERPFTEADYETWKSV